MFTAGDRIRVTNKKSEFYGYEGAFIRRNDNVVIVQLDGVPQRYAFFPENIVGIPPTSEKNKKIKIGDRLRATKDIIFCGAPGHYSGLVYTVEESTQAYYQWAMENRPGEYELLPAPTTYINISKHYPTKTNGGGTYTMTYKDLAYAICRAYARVDTEDMRCYRSSVYAYDTDMQCAIGECLFSAFRTANSEIHCVKSPACTATRAQIYAALKMMPCEK